MPDRTDRAEEIYINGFRYPVTGPVRRFLASRPTPRFVLGEDHAGAHQDISRVKWDDWRGGIGIERMDPSRDIARAWWSTCHLRQKRHLTLGALATITATSGVAGSWSVGAITDYANAIYAVFGVDVRSYTAGTNSWGSTLRTLPGDATSSLSNFRLNDVLYLAFAYTSGYDYYNGTSWATSGTDAVYLVYWEDRLWGIDSTGQLWWATTPGTETNDAQLPLVNSAVTNLFTARGPSGRTVIYASTTNGLWMHDADNVEFIRTELELPYHPDNGLGAVTWRDGAFISAGLGIYKYVHGTVAATIQPVGPDRDHGLPSDYRGRIRKLIPTLNELIALVDATSASTVTTIFDNDDTPGMGEVISPDAGRSALLGWDGQGWQVVWTSDAATLPVTVAHVANAYNDYRIWWAQNQRVYWMTLDRDIVNPTQISDKSYAASATHETPWFDADEEHIVKTAVVICTHTVTANANETIAVRYRLNDDDSSANQTAVGTITAAGHNEYILPSVTNRAGVAWRSIKFVLDFVRGSTTTNTPDLDRLEFYFVRKEEIRWGVSATVVIPTEGYGLQSAEVLHENLFAAAASGIMVEVTWRDRDADDAGTVNPYNYYMHLVGFTGTEATGNDFSGEFQIVAVERDASHR